MNIQQINEELIKPDYHFLNTNPLIAGTTMLIG